MQLVRGLLRRPTRLAGLGVILTLFILAVVPGTLGPVRGKTASPAIHKLDLFAPDGSKVGFVQYQQADNGELRLHVAIQHDLPNTTYLICLLPAQTQPGSCAGQQSDGTGIVVIGQLTSNGQGNANTGEMVIALARLGTAFGPGPHTAGFELARGGGSTGGCLTAQGGIFIVPGPNS